jgi:tetratricopeptide (TPR) repeat protein
MKQSRGRINWAFLVVLVIAVAVVVGTAVWLRYWNRSGRASAGLTLGNEAFAAENWNEAASQYGRYLGVKQDDVEILIKYAQAQIKRQPVKIENYRRAKDSLSIALRQDAAKCPESQRREAANLLVDIYLGMGMPGEAEVKAAEQFEIVADKDLQRKMALACYQQQKFPQAVETLKALIQQDPTDVSSYSLLALIADSKPSDVPGLPEADTLFEEMIAKNPTAAQAYAIRATYWLQKPDKDPGKTKALADLEKAQTCDLSKTKDRLMLASAWMSCGDLAKAREHLQALAQKESKNAEIWTTWADLAQRSGDTAEMKMVADKASASLPAGAFLSLAAELYILAGEYNTAQTCIDDLRKQDYSAGQADELQGLLAAKKQQWPVAIQSWQKAIEQGMRTERIHLKLAQAYEQMGDSVSAVQQLKNLVRENEKSVLGQLSLARLLTNLGRIEEASEAAQAAVRLAPSSAEARLVQAQVRQQMMQKGLVPNDPKAWEALAKEMESLDKSGAAGLNVRLMRMQGAVNQGLQYEAQAKLDTTQGNIDAAQRNFDAAKRQWDAAAKILEGLKKDFPDDIRVALESVELQDLQNQSEPAIAELRQVVQKYPQSLVAVRYLVRLLFLQKQTDAAIAVLTEAIGRFPSAVDKRDLTLLLAAIYGQTGQSQKGDELLQKLTSEMPDDILLKRELVTALLAQTKVEEAQSLVVAIKALEGESGWQWRYEQARVWFFGKDFTANYSKIVMLLKDNLAANPDDQASRMLLGSVHEKGGEKQLAVTTFREALTRDPDNIQVISATVSALYKASQDEQAQEILAQAQRRKPKNKETDPRLAQLQLQGFLRQENLISAADQLKAMMDQNPDSQQDRLTLAIVRIQQEQFAEAEKLLAEIRKSQPNSQAAASLMIDMRMFQNKPDEAVSVANQFVETAKTPDAYILRGRLHLRLKNSDAARADMLKAVELAPDKAQGWLYQVDFYGTTNDLPQAIKAVKEALALSPDDLEVIRRAIVLLQSSTDPADAKAGADLLEKSLVKSPKDSKLVLMKSRNLLAVGSKASYNQAIEMLKTLTREQPDVEQAWVDLSRAYLMRGDSANATDTTMRGLASLPRSVALMMSKAACEGYRTPSLAITTYQMICQKYPKNPEPALSLVRAYLQANDTRSALELLGAWKDKPQGTDQPQFALLTAAATLMSGDTATGQKLFDALYAQRPDDPAVVIIHAESIARGQKWSELVTLVTQWFAKHPTLSAPIVSFLESLVTRTPAASKDAVEPILRKMLEIKPDCVDALAGLGVMMQSSGHSSDAQPLYEKAIQLDPSRVTVLNNLAWILCEDLKQYDKALPFADQAIQKRPDYFDAYDTRGVIYYRLNQLDKSQSDLARCIDEFGAGSAALTGAYHHFGRTLFAKQLRLESTQALRKALDLNLQTQALSPADLDEIKRMMEELSK